MTSANQASPDPADASADASAPGESGKVWFITGTSRGFGREWAQAALDRGDRVAATARDRSSLDGLVASYGDRVLPLELDVTDRDADFAAVAEAHARFGRLDVVVNNAANALREDLGAFTPAGFQKSMDVNLRGPVFLVQEALPHLRESPSASIVNVISAGAFLFSAFTATYSAAKAALFSFTKSMAAEFAPMGVRVNALSPGTVDTDMVRHNPPEAQERMARAALIRRAAEPDEMVGPALFLASDASSFVTGQVLLADGGLVPH